MAERNRPHIFLDRTIDAERFTPNSGRPPVGPPPPTDPDAHSTKLSQSLSKAAEQATTEHAPALRVEGAISGVYVQFEAVPGFELALTSLEPQQGKVHPELRAVTEQTVDGRTAQMATVFIPDGWIGKFLDRFEKYATERTPKGNRKNADLVERIADLRLATLAALWTDPKAAFPDGDGPVWWELWLRRRDGVIERLDSFAEQSGVRVGTRRLVLDDRVIVLVRATAEQLGAALGVLDDIAELRRPAEAFHVLADLDAADQADFVSDLAGRLQPPPSNAPRTCVLDTGVAGSHPLIAPALDPADLHTVEPIWTIDDRRGHGTMMAGTTLYPNLGADLLTNESVPLVTRLESVKVLPNIGDNEDHLYGAITAQATSIVEIENPSTPRTFLLAVTAPAVDAGDASTLGQPTTWSSTIDALAAGRQVIDNDGGLVYLDSPDDREPRLFVVSAGNVRGPYDINHIDRSDTEPAEDPAQAWNALVIGAYTSLDDHTDEPPFDGWVPLAPNGELSPFSRTSVAYKREWRHAPDVVLEGGNAGRSPSGTDVDTPPHLQILTTRSTSLGGRLLTTTTGTSPATAAAGNLIAQIRGRYPSLWPETVRALVVHSARWTPAMSTTGNKSDHRNAVRRYGWGVPGADRALRSADDAVTLIAQQTIRPYLDGKMREMHLHDLPWPTDVLQDLGDAPVKMRVALSYFIEPNPARRGWVRRFRYPSHGLRFDVRRPTESNDAFRKRLNKLALEEDEQRPSSADDTGDWYLGPNERVRGSLHVDHWHGTAADLAARGCIAVYPVTGWWKEQPKRDRSELGVRYSLVVSIETPEVDADIWTPIAIQAAVPITIET
jgi:hypothetical protein